MSTMKNYIGLFFYIPEFVLSCFVMLQVPTNARFLNILKNKFPIITKEASHQTMTVLMGTAYIYYIIIILLNNLFLIQDALSAAAVVKILILCLSTLIIYVATPAINMQKLNHWEFFTVFLIAVISALLMIAADSLCAFYLLVELQALCFYILASIDKESIFSAEAGLKYFVSGSIISGFFLMGISFIYGSLGALELSVITNLLSGYEAPLTMPPFLLVGAFLVVATLLFKLACAPLHFWAPDVYDGAPLASTIILSVLPKLSLTIFFCRFLEAFQIFSAQLGPIVVYSGVLSAVVGTFYALKQVKVKKLLIYASIAQTGFLVASLGTYSSDGKVSALVFLFTYLLSTLALWEIITRCYVSMSLLARFKKTPFGHLYVTDFSALGKTNFTYAFALLTILFSLGGIPYLAGFFGKVSVLQALINGSYFGAATILCLIGAIAVYYYIRMIKMFFFDSRKYVTANRAFMNFSKRDDDMSFRDFVFCCIVAFLFVGFFFCDPIITLARYIIDSLFK